MQNILMEQKVGRRQKHPPISLPKFRGPAAYKPYKYIDEIRQEPARLKRERKSGNPEFSPYGPLGASQHVHRPRRPIVAAENKAPASKAAPANAEEKPSGPARPKSPFWNSPAPAYVLGGIALFSALVLGLQDSPAAALSPGDDPTMRANLASYAGVSGAVPAPEEGDELIPLDLMEDFRWESYTVQRGDSVSKIAAARSVSMDAIIASNGISNARRLREGETIRIPNMDGIPYTVKRGDTLTKISAALGVPLEAILDANDIQNDALTAGQSLFIPGARMRADELKLALGELFIYPIRGLLSSPYGWRNDPISGVRKHHAALDLAAPQGTAIKAAMDGKVATVGYNSVYGNYIILSHGSGFQTLYGHLNSTSVKQGSYAIQGTKIGEVGSTGYSTGPHLHFAVYKNGKPVNPLEYLK